MSSGEVSCPACGHSSWHASRFCPACGSRLPRRCPVCAHEAAADDAFCGQCGRALNAPDPGPTGISPLDYAPQRLADQMRDSSVELEGERKPVTVLVVDLVDSMALARRFDPEDWRLILERYFQLLAEGVYRFEGLVDQFTGDGVLALFGVPIAHEDHAERACRSAWLIRERIAPYAEELRREHGLDFAVRMGIHSDEVVVGRIGDDRHAAYAAPGYAVGLATRVEKLAPAGRIYATAASATLAASSVELRDLGHHRVRGVPEPLHVFELDGIRGGAPLGVARGQPLSPLVGRGEELDRLAGALADARAGQGRVVGVVGDPGVGKSRLCLEFVARCRRDGLRVHLTHCVSHGQAIAFLPILELLQDWFGLHGVRSPAEARERIDAALAGLAPRHRPFLPVLFDFLGVADPDELPPDMDPEARHRQVALLIGEALRRSSRDEPLVILFDDLHWIDAASHDLLASIADAVAGTRTLLLTNYRPEYRASWQHADHARPIQVEPLGAAASDALLRQLLGPSPDLFRLAPRILERTGGNPFFVEEVIRSLAEQGVLVGEPGHYRLAVAQIEIPESLHAVIAARIDRLDEAARRLLHTAAVIGRKFPTAVLAAASRLDEAAVAATLAPALEAGLVHAERGPEPGYAFHHPLTHEVAYRSQLERRRARQHALVAEVIHDRSTGRVDERAALLAYHWENAGKTEQAAVWHARAAEWRSTDHAPASMQHWQRVRELVRELPESEETSRLAITAHVRLLNLGWRLGVTETEAETIYEEGKRLAQRSGDHRSLAMLANLYGAIVQSGLGRSPRDGTLVQRAREAARLADATDDPGVRLGVRVSQLYSRFLAGELRSALALVEQTLTDPPDDLRLGIEMFRFSPLLWIRSFHGQLLSYMGRPREAEDALREALDWARDQRETENLGWAEDFCVTRAWAAGDGPGALDHARSAVGIADDTGSTFSRIRAYKALGLAHLVNAQWGEAGAALDTALGIGREQQANVYEEPSVLAHLAEARLHSGDPKAADQLARSALAAARRRNARLYECEAEIAHAGALLGLGDGSARDAIAGALDRAAALIEHTGADSYAPFLLERRAELAGREADEVTRRGALETARRLYREMGATGHAERITRALSKSGA